jgi:hypothetical protein
MVTSEHVHFIKVVKIILEIQALTQSLSTVLQVRQINIRHPIRTIILGTTSSMRVQIGICFGICIRILFCDIMTFLDGLKKAISTVHCFVLLVIFNIFSLYFIFIHSFMFFLTVPAPWIALDERLIGASFANDIFCFSHFYCL